MTYESHAIKQVPGMGIFLHIGRMVFYDIVQVGRNHEDWQRIYFTTSTTDGSQERANSTMWTGHPHRTI